MPTLAKLVAAVAFCAVAWVAAWFYRAGMPPGAQAGWLAPVAAAIGAVIGWFVMGRLVGEGYRAALGSGLRTSVTLVVWCLLVFDTALMLRKAVRMRYDGPMEAVTDIFRLSLDSAQLLLLPGVLATLLLGGLAGGVAAEAARRRLD